jgi:hypothetical protein
MTDENTKPVYIVARGRTVVHGVKIDGASIEQSFGPGARLPAHVTADSEWLDLAVANGFVYAEGGAPIVPFVVQTGREADLVNGQRIIGLHPEFNRGNAA